MALATIASLQKAPVKDFKFKSFLHPLLVVHHFGGSLSGQLGSHNAMALAPIVVGAVSSHRPGGLVAPSEPVGYLPFVRKLFVGCFGAIHNERNVALKVTFSTNRTPISRRAVAFAHWFRGQKSIPENTFGVALVSIVFKSFFSRNLCLGLCNVLHCQADEQAEA
ncbi:hypothetical protein RT717_01790 [Imperialibacter roseus]|uniref:Uncharacterized protein n=1 Tax=Imperialibacter roseus TaxID=1324217 RepID=A0ABZ0IQM2_9BACT|nr:hypothetical protein [Imperialibacter roseus]WOK07352.1 hypothetical protein RT717_01790 [Imperialibacter roseus]